MKRIGIGLLIAGAAVALTACGGADRDEEIAGVKLHSVDRAAYSNTTIGEAFDPACQEIDDTSIVEAIGSAIDDGAEDRGALLLAGGAIRTTCTDFQDEFDSEFGDTYDGIVAE
jgi:hypothetical protein